MKYLLPLPIAAFLVTVVVPAHAIDGDRPRVGSSAPRFEWTREDGTREPALTEKDTVELLVFLRAGQPYSKLVDESVTNVAASVGGEPLRVRRIWVAMSPEDVTGKETKKPYYCDPKREAAAAFGLIAYPTTIVVGRDRKILEILVTRPPRFDELLEAAVLFGLGRIDESELQRRRSNDSESASGHGSPEDRAIAVARLAVSLTRSGRLSEAESHFARALELAPRSREVQVLWGEYLIDRGRLEEGQQVVEQLLAVDETVHSPAVRLLDARLDLASDRTEQALEKLQALLPMSPKKVKVHLELGRAFEKLHRWKEAAEHYRAGLELAIEESQNSATKAATGEG
ncbi:MAG: tetratricopeptide repeat protein [Planctomycetes bacterium]|nr:tetratricopeptide repeat protein [Planctomycetota bacterium]